MNLDFIEGLSEDIIIQLYEDIEINNEYRTSHCWCVSSASDIVVGCKELKDKGIYNIQGCINHCAYRGLTFRDYNANNYYVNFCYCATYGNYANQLYSCPD